MAQPNSITYIIHESWFQRSSIFSLNENQIESPEVLGESIKYTKKTTFKRELPKCIKNWLAFAVKP